MTLLDTTNPRPKYLTPRARRRMEQDRIWASLLDAVLTEHRVARRDMLGARKFAPVVAARDVFILALFETGRFSMCEIGRRIGMHHTAVGDALRRQRARVLA